jgi:hypothetical protein
MANLCDNTLYVFSEDPENMNYIKKFFKENVYHGFEIDEDIPEELIVKFESNWTFPIKTMNELIAEIPNNNDIDMRCLSVELCNLYHELYWYNGDEWRSV